MIDQTASLRLSLLRFPPIIGVLYIHAYGTVIYYPGGSFGTDQLNAVTNFIRILISEGLARTAVPLFFLIAGYLFFATFHWSVRTYRKKLTARFHSLLIPFLFWNLLTLVFFALAQSIPAIQPYYTGTGKPISQFGIFDYLNALFGLKGYPIAYHFWFIRDLMLLVLLAPLIAVVVRFVPWLLLGGVYLCWVTDTWPVLAPGAVGVLFFAGGAWCGINKISLFAADRFAPALFISYPVLLVLDVIWYDASFNIYLHRTSLIIGVAAALCATKYLIRSPWLSRLLVFLGGASFFVYAAHEPLLRTLRLLAFSHVPLDASYTMLALYLGIPVAVIIILLLCHELLQRGCPRFLSVISGGR